MIKKTRLLACLAIILSLFSCAKDDTITLTLYNYRDTSTPDSDRWDRLFKEFNTRHPEITLIVENGFNDPYHLKLQALAAAGCLPDIVKLWPGKKTGYFDKKAYLQDLRPRLKEHINEFKPFIFSPQGPNGEIYELPDSINISHIIYTNERLLKRLNLTFPATFEELSAQSTIIRKANLIPIAMSNKDGWQMQSSLLSVLMHRTCGDEWCKNVVTGNQAAFLDKGFVNALEIIKTMSDNKMFSPGVNEAEYETSLEDFISEKAVYYIDGSWKNGELISTLTDEQKEYISLHTFPRIKGQKSEVNTTSAAIGAGFAMNINLEGKHADAAWQWIWFYTGPQGAKINSAYGTNVSYKLALTEDTDVLRKKFNDFSNNLVMGPIIDNIMDSEGVVNVLENDIKEVMAGSITCVDAAFNYEFWVSKFDTGRTGEK